MNSPDNTPHMSQGDSAVPVPHDPCPFCPDQVGSRLTDSNRNCVSFLDRFPVTPGHRLIAPRRHTASFLTMSDIELSDAVALLRKLARDMTVRDASITGFNIGANCGEVAGQTVPHAHIHLIPRRRGDTPDPAGGVRSVIPEKRNY